MPNGRDGSDGADPTGVRSGDGKPSPPAWRLAEVRRLGEELGRAIDGLSSPSDLRADAVPFAGAIVETLHEPMLVLRPDLTVETANPSFYRHFKVKPEETLGRMIYDLGNGQWNISALRTALEEVLPHSKVIHGYEVIHEFEGIGRRVMLINARQLDHVQMILIGVRDVTAEHGVASVLRDSESRYRTMVENLPDYAMLMTDTSGVITEWTKGAERVTRYSAEEAIGQHVSLIYTPEQAASDYIEREFGEAVETGRAEREDWRMRKGGERFWANEIVTTIRDAQGELCGFAKITRDLGARRWMENALQASEERFRLIVDNVQDYAILTTDSQGRITSWNPGALRIFQYSPDEVMGRDAGMLFTPEDRGNGEHVKELKAAARDGRASDDRWQIRKDGSRFWASGVATAIRDADNRLLGYVKILRDETSRKKLEEELRQSNEALEQRVADRTGTLRQSQRQLRALLAEAGRSEARQRRMLATELHDNLAQLLAVSKIRVSAIEAQAGKDAVRQEASAVKEALGEAISYTRTIMADLRPDVLDEHDVTAAIEWVAKRMARHGLKVNVSDDGEPKPLHEDVLAFLFQAVRELLWNVVKHARTTEANVHIAREESVVRITVEDEGVGFDHSRRAALPSEQAGYGLFNITERIDLFGGKMEIDTALRRGTRVTLTAPLELTSEQTNDPGNEPVRPSKN